MKSFIFAIVLVLAFGANSWAINLRPYMQTPPEVQMFAKRVIEDGGQNLLEGHGRAPVLDTRH